ncbi:MAG: M20 family metallo-hydrolase [Syntrophales bacterium]|nr:M20 family metallo-hydrolase [Syntrophales bacterium]HPB70049.1 M20 family metallo-hydrolase [Syntrophales bacterium]HQN25281.1 M20 family metallo-hydrolase [Syntrophales bacterium]
MNLQTFKRLTDRIEGYEPEMVQMQIDLCSYPALSPDNGGDGEQEKALYLQGSMRRLGLTDIETLPAPDSRVSSGLRPNILVRLPGHQPDKTVWILTHMDVVPPGEPSHWASDPYRAEVRNGRIYGRGTEDNQQDLVASIFALRAFYELGVTPEYNLGLALVADEETSSRFGVRHLLDQVKPVFRKNDLIVVPDFGDAEGTAIEIAEKSLYWLRFRTTGRQCHGSRPDLGRNAFAAAAHLVVRLRELYDLFPLRNPLYEPQESTFEPTRRDANVPNVNTIPGDDVFYLDARVLPEYPLTRVLEAIRALADDIEQIHQVGIVIETVQSLPAPPPTPADAPVVAALREAVHRVYGLHAKPVGIGAGTVAALLRQEGYPVAVWSRQNETAHQINENCLISNMIGNAKVFAHLGLNPV